MSTTKIASECQVKRARIHDENLSYCHGCRLVYCDWCYEVQAVHEEESNCQNHHEKTSLQVANFVLSVFDSGLTEIERNQKHNNNIYTKWFGALNDDHGKSYFHDFGGYIRLLQDSAIAPSDFHPSLITFVGDTGEGKSTLINGILKLPAEITTFPPDDVHSPVMGAGYQQTVPTSGDVHVFCDPRSRDTNHPVYYVDCEGMDGGDALPTSAICLENLKERFGDISFLIHKKREVSQPITRAWAVKQLYPRILFPFSDVVCLVAKNSRAFEAHLAKLLQWADIAIDKTTNQPMLPQAFMIFNAFDPKEAPDNTFFQDWWDTNQVTEEFLKPRDSVISCPDSSLGKLAASWMKRGRKIDNLMQLILCYFREFKIFCIPKLEAVKHSHTLGQYRALQNALSSASEGARQRRRESGFLMSAITLKRYLELAFDHFTTTPDEPFNFLSFSLIQNSVTQTMKDHICKLAAMYLSTRKEATSGREIFKKFAPWVASCIFLDSHRQQLPNMDIAEEVYDQYSVHCRDAWVQFYNRSWPCEASDSKDNRCVNVRATHTTKGHQNSSGKIFEINDPGPDLRRTFMSSDNMKYKEEFLTDIKSNLNQCIRNYKSKTSERELNEKEIRKEASRIHVAIFEQENYRKVVKNLISHWTCFCCLASSPAHKLFCGHVLCQSCLEDYSKANKKLLHLVLEICPLCGANEQRLTVEIKPPTAGVRILCLDGGGIRSIMQLEILSCIEREIGLDIPIARYFDLIIGTSGGGVVAAAIGLKHLSVSDSISMFKEFAASAFVPRYMVDWPILGKFILAHHHGRYKTSALKDVLKNAFGEQWIFGDIPDPNTSGAAVFGPKVALTATSSNRKAYLLSNYNRPPPEKKSLGRWKKVKARVKGRAADLRLPRQLRHPMAARRSKVEDRNSTVLISTESIAIEDEKVNGYIIESVNVVSSDDEGEETVNPENCESDDEIYGNAGDDPGYEFFRGEDKFAELRLWEAVRATSAAPGYFKSFSHATSKYTFNDGALRCNNPVFVADKERKVIWPELSTEDPDIMLSLGTGFDPQPPKIGEPPSPPQTGVASFIQMVTDMGYLAVMEDMDCEKKWREFTNGLRIDEQDEERLSRYKRLNPPLKSPIPKLDAVNEVDNLQEKVLEWLRSEKVATEIRIVANTLVASLFYFEFIGVSAQPCLDLEGLRRGSTLTCKGRIQCRIGSIALLKKLELYDKDLDPKPLKSDLFSIGKKNGSRSLLKAVPTHSNDRISYDVRFDLQQVDDDEGMCICIHLWKDGNFPNAVSISGFPRSLYPEAELLSKRTAPRKLTFRYLPLTHIGERI